MLHRQLGVTSKSERPSFNDRKQTFTRKASRLQFCSRQESPELLLPLSSCSKLLFAVYCSYVAFLPALPHESIWETFQEFNVQKSQSDITDSRHRRFLAQTCPPAPFLPPTLSLFSLFQMSNFLFLCWAPGNLNSIKRLYLHPPALPSTSGWNKDMEQIKKATG